VRYRGIGSADDVPVAYQDAVAQHYRDVFGPRAAEVERDVPELEPGETLYVAHEEHGRILGAPVGGVLVLRRRYDVRFRGFIVFPEFRGRGFAREMMDHVRELAAEGVPRALPGVAYATSLVYPIGSEFGRYLRKRGFQPYPHRLFKWNRLPWEQRAVETYLSVGVDEADLVVFRKKVADDGVYILEDARREIDGLTPEQRATVEKGLDIKLGAAYGGSGRVSYRFDLCPVCSEMGSTEKDDSACRDCYIRRLCRFPFGEEHRFKEDPQVSLGYWEAVRQYLVNRRDP